MSPATVKLATGGRCSRCVSANLSRSALVLNDPAGMVHAQPPNLDSCHRGRRRRRLVDPLGHPQLYVFCLLLVLFAAHDGCAQASFARVVARRREASGYPATPDRALWCSTRQPCRVSPHSRCAAPSTSLSSACPFAVSDAISSAPIVAAAVPRQGSSHSRGGSGPTPGQGQLRRSGGSIGGVHGSSPSNASLLASSGHRQSRSGHYAPQFPLDGNGRAGWVDETLYNGPGPRR